MSRHGYHDDLEDNWASIRWRGCVASAMRGKRGQAFLRELLAALDAMPEKRLVSAELITDEGEVCAIGAVCKARGLDVADIDESDPYQVAAAVGLAPAMVREIAYENDDGAWHDETPERRWQRMRAWIASEIKDPTTPRTEGER